MPGSLRVLGCVMTLTAMLAPWAGVVRTAVHLALASHHHEEASRTDDDVDDAAEALHGHSHEHGIPAHSHAFTVTLASAQGPVPSLTIHPAVSAAGCAAFAADAAVLDRFDPSPPPRAPIILRI